MLGSDFWLVGVVLGLGRLLLSDFGSLLVLLGRRFVGKFLRTVGGIRWLVGIVGVAETQLWLAESYRHAKSLTGSVRCVR